MEYEPGESEWKRKRNVPVQICNKRHVEDCECEEPEENRPDTPRVIIRFKKFYGVDQAIIEVDIPFTNGNSYRSKSMKVGETLIITENDINGD
jgi:hypothetical protein